MSRYLKLLIILFLFYLCSGNLNAIVRRDTMDLAGEWRYRLFNAPIEIAGEGIICLPNTLDNARKSVYNPETTQTENLRREYSFIGKAVYSKRINIPENWDGKNIELYLERTKPTVLKLDGKTIGHNSIISSSQRYNLTPYITPGPHEIEIIVDNLDSIPPMVKQSHAISESTQTNWNGILGKIALISSPILRINKVKINDYDIIDSMSFSMNFSIFLPTDYILSVAKDGQQISSAKVKEGEEKAELKFAINQNELWSASNPKMHELTFTLTDQYGVEWDKISLLTGFRSFRTHGNQFIINGQPVFLRGTVNAAVFPTTTFPPMGEEEWIDYFNKLKEYGFNHVRFHSWTPPEAAFKAADLIGIYILSELPIWGEMDKNLTSQNRFLKEELKGIMEDFAHHPSFVMFSPGNELWGDINEMSEFKEWAKEYNPRILTTYGTNIYLGLKGQIADEDFIISAKTSYDINDSLRGSVSFADSSEGGIFNSIYPNSNYILSKALQNISVPVISHEVGQYEIYPAYDEIKKFGMNLKADNLKEYEKHAIQSGLIRKSSQFHNASGKWAAKLYKAEMEMAQRSPGIAGIELFGLQDYPGQGGAFVGLLDSFMESKNFIDPENWRESCEDLIVIAEFTKFTYLNGETLEIPVKLINYTDRADTIRKINWKMPFEKGTLNVSPGHGIVIVDTIRVLIPKIKTPQQFKLTFTGDNKKSINNYDFWVYPEEMKEIKNINITNDLAQALVWLRNGEKVILYSDSVTIAENSVGPLFTTDFWNYRMYKKICDDLNIPPSPGTLGLLIDHKHPIFNKFPTERHTDWQWYPIVSNSRPLIIDRLPKEYDPLVEVIDNPDRNYPLGLIMEFNIGRGNLIIVSSDLDKASEFPEGKWLIQSIKEYMNSKEFKPKFTLTESQLMNLLTNPTTSRKIELIKEKP